MSSKTTRALYVHCGGRLSADTFTVGGDREAAVALLAAAAATGRQVRLSPVPASGDVRRMTELVEACGWSVTRCGRDAVVEAARLDAGYPEADLTAAGMIAGSYYLAPALLSGFGRAELPWPGGSSIADRALEPAFKVFELFGDSVTEHEDGYLIVAGTAPRRVEVALPYRSRGATITALLRCASLSSTEVEVHNADISPVTMAVLGALIGIGHGGGIIAHGDGMRLSPGRRAKHADWQVPGDALEAVAVACAMLATGGRGTITGIDARELEPFARLAADAGLYAEPDKDRLHIRQVTRYRDRPWAGIRAHTGTGPRTLSAAVEPLLMALALATPGAHKLENRVEPGRHASLIPQFEAMGAQFTRTSAQCAAFTGSQALRGASVHAGDGVEAAALLIAALTATGTTEITGSEHLDQLYDDLPGTLAALGANLELAEVGRERIPRRSGVAASPGVGGA